MNPVTIDPEDHRMTDWLAEQFNTTAYGIRTTLSAFAAAQSSPAEPSGTGAVITDANDRTWVAIDTRKKRWRRDSPSADTAEAREWLDLWHPVTVLSEGYTPEAKS